MLLSAAVRTAGDIAVPVVQLTRQHVAVMARGSPSRAPVFGLGAIRNAGSLAEVRGRAADPAFHWLTARDAGRSWCHRRRTYMRSSSYPHHTADLPGRSP
jgi:hypothetical protein